MRAVVERDGHRIDADGLVHGVLLGDLHPVPVPDEAGMVAINGDRWRLLD